jgi:hypothetical protein
MTSDSGAFMVVFLLLILIFALFITFLILNKNKVNESYGNYKPFRGRAPDAPPSCCGNLDWYLGSKKYNEYCSGKEENYDKEKLQEFFGNLQENISRSNDDDCKKMGLKPAYNPSVCTEEDSYEPSANCKCVDNNNNCKLCYDKIKFN